MNRGFAPILVAIVIGILSLVTAGGVYTVNKLDDSENKGEEITEELLEQKEIVEQETTDEEISTTTIENIVEETTVNEELEVMEVDEKPTEIYTPPVQVLEPVTLIDICLNIEGIQTAVPKDYVSDKNICTLIEDVCFNIDGIQEKVPGGMIRDKSLGCMTEDELGEIQVELGQIIKTSNSVQISWTTNIPTNSKVTITKTPTISNTDNAQYLPSANGLSAKGLVSVVGLEQNTEYYYIIESTAENKKSTLDGEFVTPKSSENIANEAAAFQEQQNAERRSVISVELDEIDCRQMGCFISLESLDKYNSLSKELYQLGGSHFGCSFDIAGGRAKCTGIGG